MSYYNGLRDHQENWMFANGEEASGEYACAKLTAKLKAQNAIRKKYGDKRITHWPPRKESPDAGSISTGEPSTHVPKPGGRSGNQPGSSQEGQ